MSSQLRSDERVGGNFETIERFPAAAFVIGDDDLARWLKSLPREQAAALTGVWIGTQGQPRLTLADKRAALMDIAKLFGWIVEKRENKIVDEFDTMTTEQIEAWLDERAEQRVRIRRRRRPAAAIGTLRPTTARGKPH